MMSRGWVISLVLLALSLVSAPAWGQKRDQAAETQAPRWIHDHLGEIRERVLPIGGELRGEGMWAARCRIDVPALGAPQLVQLIYEGGDGVRLKRRVVDAKDWNEVYERLVAERVPLDVDAWAARVPVKEQVAVGEAACPALTELEKAGEELRIPTFVADLSVHAYGRIDCEMESWGGSRVRVSLQFYDADETWTPFVAWVKKLAVACAAK